MAQGRKTGGRKPGTPNKATAEIKALAGQYSAEVVERLAYLMKRAKSEQAQVAACKELLDRAHGRAPQAIDAGPDLRKLIIEWLQP